MGLSLIVGILADLQQYDDEGLQHYLDEFAQINRILVEQGLPEHHEPTQMEGEVWSGDMPGYSGLHDVRRLAAYIWKGEPLPEPASVEVHYAPEKGCLSGILELFTGNDLSAMSDPIVRQFNADMQAIADGKSQSKSGFPATGFSHLMIHADFEGYYLPVDFQQVIFADVSGIMIGSSQRLLDELAFLADKIHLPLDTDEEEIWQLLDSTPVESDLLWKQYRREAFGIYQLYRGASASIEKKSALVFI